jgi:hypothetical protein
MPKSLRELLEQAKRDPLGLTPGERRAVQRELLQQAKARGLETATPAMRAYAEREQARSSKARTKARLSARDIAQDEETEWVHAPRNPQRRADCEGNLRLWIESYRKISFPLPWCRDHLRMIDETQDIILHGGLKLFCAPRGIGKTAIMVAGAEWAECYGHREFVEIISSVQKAALRIIKSIKGEFEDNELLEQDFSEICGPIRAMKGSAARARSQLYNGESTGIEWLKDLLVLPTLPPLTWFDNQVPKNSSGIIGVMSMTGDIRGPYFRRPDGRIVRPGLILSDDIQSDESAGSPAQSAGRARTMLASVLGLAGPGTKMACFIAANPIRANDLIDQWADPDKFPQWRAERMSTVYTWPTDMKLWAEYLTLRGAKGNRKLNIEKATAFYADHRTAMDAGAEVGWADRYEPGDLSALQYAFNLKQDLGESVFAAEYQCKPILDGADVADLIPLDPAVIVTRTNGLKAFVAPERTQKITAFIDVQQTLLWWMLCAWNLDFTGTIIGYGSWPQQDLDYFDLTNARPYASDPRITSTTVEGQIFEALGHLTADLFSPELVHTESGTALPINLCPIDSGAWQEVISSFVRRSRLASVMIPAKGIPIQARNRPMDQYHATAGKETIGFHHYITTTKDRTSRLLINDVNFWKTFVSERMRIAPADAGALTLYEREADGRPADHRMLADHLTAEYAIRTEGWGRVVFEWKNKPGRLRNDWLDTLVGCCAAAAMCGCRVIEPGAPAVKAMSLRERWENKHGHAEAARQTT